MDWLFGPSKASTSSEQAPVQSATAQQASSNPDACPVDHSTRSRWLQQRQQQQQQSGEQSVASASHPFAGPSARPPPATVASRSSSLSQERETSTIPRFNADGAASEHASPSGKWVYPSPSQFYNALQRKNRNPREEDMDIVVPIHNAVNERTWNEVMRWEDEALGPAAAKDAVQLVNFKGRPNDRTPRAWWKVLLG